MSKWFTILLFLAIAQCWSQEDSDLFLQTYPQEEYTSHKEESEENEEGYKQLVQELFQSDLVYPQERGELQISYIPQFSKNNEEKLFENTVVFEYGITEAWQVELEWIFLGIRDPKEEDTVEGIGDLTVGTQYSFMNISKSNVHFALGFEVTFPTGDIDDGFTEGFIEYEPYFVLAIDFPEVVPFHFFLQAGFGFLHEVREADNDEEEEEGEDAHEFFLNAGFYFTMGPVSMTFEWNWETNEWNNDGDENEVFFTPGIVWNLPGAWELGLGVPIGLTEDADDYRVLLVLSYEFNLFEDDDDDDDDDDD